MAKKCNGTPKKDGSGKGKGNGGSMRKGMSSGGAKKGMK